MRILDATAISYPEVIKDLIAQGYRPKNPDPKRISTHLFFEKTPSYAFQENKVIAVHCDRDDTKIKIQELVKKILHSEEHFYQAYVEVSIAEDCLQEPLPPLVRELKVCDTLESLWKQVAEIQTDLSDPSDFVVIDGIDERLIHKKFLLEAKEIPNVSLEKLSSLQVFKEEGSEDRVLILSGFEKVVLMHHSEFFRNLFEKETSHGAVSIPSIRALEIFIDTFYEQDELFFESLSLSPFQREKIEYLFELLRLTHNWKFAPPLEKLENFLVAQFTAALEKDLALAEKIGAFCNAPGVPPSLKGKCIKAMEKYLQAEIKPGEFGQSNSIQAELSKIFPGWVITFSSDNFGHDHLCRLGKLPIEKLRLFGNGISDVGLQYLEACQDLLEIRLSNCDKVADRGLLFLKNCKKLRKLTLQSCEEITGTGLKVLKHCPDLLDVELFKCTNISDEGLKFLENCTNLLSLKLYWSRIDGDGLKFLENCRRLLKLDLSFCDKITGDKLKFLENCTKLQSLKLYCCKKITDSALEFLKNCPDLLELDLSYCHEMTDKKLKFLENCTNLKSLKLAGCKKITGAGFEFLKNCINLQTIDLYTCAEMTDVGLKFLENCKTLKILDLNHCSEITDEGLKYLANRPSLEVLNCSGLKKITNRGLEHLSALKNLKKLSLFRCSEITDEGFRALVELPLEVYVNKKGCPKITDEGLAQLLKAFPAMKMKIEDSY